MRIDDLNPADSKLVDALTDLSHAAAASHAPNWLPTLAAAREEVVDATASGHITRVFLQDNGAPAGWISAVRLYGAVWEVHPLLVSPQQQRRGIGAKLVADIEAQTKARGAGVLFVSTSDEVNATSLGGRDVYPNPLAALVNIEITPGHAAGFWLRQGYAIAGMIPDAEGPGKPSIHFTKRLG